MQKLHTSRELPWAGELVDVRRARWHVAAVTIDREVSFARLHGTERTSWPDPLTLLHPFDRFAPVPEGQTLKRGSRSRALRRLAELILAARSYDLARSIASAPLDVPAWQLVPLLAFRRGIAARLLLADAVGLGKTVQAGLVIHDLLEREPHAAVLVLTPAGLREQWQHELNHRLGVRSSIVDAFTLQATAADRPESSRGDVSPWRSWSVAITSIDFVKQVDVREGLLRDRWQLLVVDEAHALTWGSDRLAAADAIARCSDRVLLLTATPHDGRDVGFRALSGVGRLPGHTDPIVFVRRTADQVGLARRRVTRRLHVRPSQAERHLDRLLDRYVARLRLAAVPEACTAAHLVATVLLKRAASSPTSLLRSLERRRALLSAAPTFDVQPDLPFGPASAATDDEEPDLVLGTRVMEARHERVWLNVLINAATAATRDERKVRTLKRLIRRIPENTLVFTEYRDTLLHLERTLSPLCQAALLHGALAPDARKRAIDAFNAGTVRLLLATDAASEGLNLHERCRLAVSVDLPWNPVRLEQRIGRVDRIGQSRTVHAVCLVLRETSEARLAARLEARGTRMQEALVDGESYGSSAESGERGADTLSEARPIPADLMDDAAQVEREVTLVRRLHARVKRVGTRRSSRWTRPVVADVRRACLRWRLPRGVIVVFRTRLRRNDGNTVDDLFTPVFWSLGAHLSSRISTRTIATLLDRDRDVARRRVREAIAVRIAAIEAGLAHPDAVAARRTAVWRSEVASRAPDQLPLFLEFAAHTPPRRTSTPAAIEALHSRDDPPGPALIAADPHPAIVLITR